MHVRGTVGRADLPLHCCRILIILDGYHRLPPKMAQNWSNQVLSCFVGGNVRISGYHRRVCPEKRATDLAASPQNGKACPRGRPSVFDNSIVRKKKACEGEGEQLPNQTGMVSKYDPGPKDMAFLKF